MGKIWERRGFCVMVIILFIQLLMGFMGRSGLLFVFSGPSGSGKTTITGALLARESQLCRSISATTRAPRAGEIHGTSYYFFDTPSFIRAAQEDLFAEHAKVFHNHYGTLKAPLAEACLAGRDVLLTLDWQGAQSIKKLYQEKAVLIYILPPNMTALKKRLDDRGQDGAENIEQRLACAYTEINHCVHYDYILVNDDLDQTIDQAWSIIQSEGVRCKNQSHLDPLLRRILACPPH